MLGIVANIMEKNGGNNDQEQKPMAEDEVEAGSQQPAASSQTKDRRHTIAAGIVAKLKADGTDGGMHEQEHNPMVDAEREATWQQTAGSASRRDQVKNMLQMTQIPSELHHLAAPGSKLQTAPSQRHRSLVSL